MSVHDGQPIHVGCVHPAESLSCHALEVTTLIAILSLDLMRVDRPGHIVFLNHNPVEIDKGLGDYVEPFVRQALRFFVKAITNQTRPSEDLLGSPTW